MGTRNDDISLILAKAKKQGFLPDVKDEEVDILTTEAQSLFLNDSGLGTAFLSNQAPSYSSSRAHSWNASRCLYNGESPTLKTIRSLIRKGRAGTRVRVTAAGDSKTAGSGSLQPQVATNSYPGQLTELLGANPGFVHAVSWDTRWSAITGLTDAGTSQLYMSASGAWSITFTSLSPFTDFKIYAYISPGGTINVTVDTVAQTAFTVGSGSTWKASSTYSGFANTTHTVTLSGTSATSLLGIEPVFSSGLTISNAGRPSSSAAEWLWTTDWSKLYSSVFGANNAQLTKPDIAIIGIGTNTNSSTLADITTFITNVSSVLAIPTLIVVFGGVGSSGSHDAKRTQLYSTADTLNLPLVDFTALIGDSPAATALGLMTDTVHESTAGYSLEADLLARILTY